MDATSFALNISLPSDTRFLPAIRDVAVHAARYAGCRASDADSFGATVEGIVSQCVASHGEPVKVIVRRDAGPVEVLIACARRFDVGSTRDSHITVEWTEEHGHHTCRVARSMPAPA
jgi:hypothetical protein